MRPQPLEFPNTAGTSLNQQGPLVPTPSPNDRKDVTFLVHPGVYEIYDTETGFSYYGETYSLSHRLNNHREQLSRGTHENTALMRALASNPSITRFQFFVLDSGPEWADQQKRVQRENAYIEANRTRCFNAIEPERTENQPPRVCNNVPVMARGVRYQSQRHAASALGIGRTTLKRYCNDPNNTEFRWLYEESALWSCTPIFGKKGDSPSLLFSSFQECIDAGFATSKQNARRKIQRNELGWKYAHVDSRGMPLRTPYTLKPGEISYKQWAEQNKM